MIKFIRKGGKIIPIRPKKGSDISHKIAIAGYAAGSLYLYNKTKKKKEFKYPSYRDEFHEVM